MSITRIFLLFVLPLALFLWVTSSSTHGQIAKETPLMTKHLPDMPGKEGLVETVVLSPGEVVRAHRHNADVFAICARGKHHYSTKGW